MLAEASCGDSVAISATPAPRVTIVHAFAAGKAKRGEERRRGKSSRSDRVIAIPVATSFRPPWKGWESLLSI